MVRMARTECSSSDESFPTIGSDSTVPDHNWLGETLLLPHPEVINATPSPSAHAAGKRILTMSP
jgi:hypothetical protein